MVEMYYTAATSLEDAWFQSLRSAMENGRLYTIDDGSFKGKQRREIPFTVIRISHPGARPLAPMVPQGVPSPSTDEVIEEYLNYLMSPVKAENEEYTYAEDLAPQVEEVIKKYSEKGFETNQCCMSLGSRDSIYLKDPQCLRVVDTRVQDGQLHFAVYFRSWDLWGGFPTNLGGLQLVKEYMAKELGIQDGELLAMSKGLHLYDHCWDYAKMVLKEEF